MMPADDPVSYRLRFTHHLPSRRHVDEFGGVWLYTRCCGWVFA